MRSGPQRPPFFRDDDQITTATTPQEVTTGGTVVRVLSDMKGFCHLRLDWQPSRCCCQAILAYDEFLCNCSKVEII